MKKIFLLLLVFIGLSAQSQNLIGFTSDKIIQIQKEDPRNSFPAFGKTNDSTEYMSFANSYDDVIHLYYLDHERCFMYEIRTCYKNLNDVKKMLNSTGTKTNRGTWSIIEDGVHYEAWLTLEEKYFSATYVIQTEN